MNKRQKIVQRALLKDEKEVIEELKKSYKEALNNINTVILQLLARKDTENLQSIIYQVDFQKSLKKQIKAFLEILETNNFKTISEYLETCYKEGWVGTLFDLQGQGVPLFMPIDQDQVVEAIKNNTKLSESLYKRLNVDITELNKTIQSELSRGIAQSLSYEEIARNIRNVANVPYNNAIRIARTEGHRIQNESAYNCQVKAKKKGANIIKQWDSTLDAKTRPTHQVMDGQIVDVDKPFKSPDGYEAMYPGSFGVASEDINCRCALLQRAKWALSDEEFTKMNGETNELQHFENLEDYDKFKSEFWKWENKK